MTLAPSRLVEQVQSHGTREGVLEASADSARGLIRSSIAGSAKEALLESLLPQPCSKC